MKWIGQNIYDQIARFRNDIFLEGIATSTETDMLVVDSNNKVSKRAIDAITVDVSDFMADGANNRVLTATGTDAMQAETYLTFENTGNVSALYNLSNQDTGDYLAITTTTHGRSYIVTNDDDATAAHLNIQTDGNLTLDSAGDIALEAAGNDVTIDSDTVTVTSATADQPTLKLLNTTDDDQASRLIFEKLRDDDGVATGQNLGEIWFRGQDNAQNTEDYAYIISEIDVSTGGQESGKLTLGVASHDGTNQPGVVLTGGSVSQEVDATIGNGAASVTTVSGTLTMGSTAFVNNSGVVQVATQGTIDHDSLANFVANEHLDWTANIESTTIHADNIPTLNQDTTGSAATLTNARDFRVALASTSAVSFDGSANVSPGVNGTLAVGNGGTGLTSISTLLNSNVTTISGNAGTATNLVASTSTAVQLGTVELGHADDTTLARSASGIVSVEGKNIRTEDRHLFIKQGSFSINPGTSEIYFPMTGTAENTSPNGVSIPFIAPVNGRLLKIHFRSNKDHSGFNQTFTLVNWDNNETFTTGNASDVGAKTVTGVATNEVITIDFQSGLDSGTNAFTVGEMIALSVTNASSIGSTTKYLFTAVFEFDFSSY